MIHSATYSVTHSVTHSVTPAPQAPSRTGMENQA